MAARAGWDVSRLARAFLDGGARLIQIRAKTLPSGRFLEHAQHLVEAAAPYGAAVIVNDRVDLALLARAAGVHLGQEDLAPAKARDLLGPNAVIGYSTHTIDQLEAAVREPITYVAVGPIVGTHTKQTGYEPVGLDLVRHAVRLAGGRPVVAIGGITLATAPEVIAAGATSVAVISDLLTGGDPAAQVRSFLDVLKRTA